jgi:hypothetical protein
MYIKQVSSESESQVTISRVLSQSILERCLVITNMCNQQIFMVKDAQYQWIRIISYRIVSYRITRQYTAQ